MQDLQISHADLNKLLCAKNPDAALLYLYIHSGADITQAETALGLPQTRYACAAATLRQMGLWPEVRNTVFAGERPQYTEQDVVGAMGTDRSFQSLYGEVQRVLGRTLNTEELKILLGFIRYLGLSTEVISMLIYYCKDKARAKGQRLASRQIDAHRLCEFHPQLRQFPIQCFRFRKLRFSLAAQHRAKMPLP